MKSNKVGRIALAAALASSVLVNTPTFSFAQSASEVLVSLSTQVESLNFSGARTTIETLQSNGVTGISIGGQTISLVQLLELISAAKAGQMTPVGVAAYLEALGTSTAQALFVPSENTVSSTDRYPVHRPSFERGSEG